MTIMSDILQKQIIAEQKIVANDSACVKDSFFVHIFVLERKFTYSLGGGGIGAFKTN